VCYRSTKHAYVVFPSTEIATAVVDHVIANPVELDGRQVIVRHYTEPPHHVPKGTYTILVQLWTDTKKACLCGLSDFCSLMSFFVVFHENAMRFWVHAWVLLFDHGHVHTQPFYGRFPVLPGWAGARRNLVDKSSGEISEAGKSSIRLGATPSGLISNPPPPSRHFYAGCPSCRNPPNLSWLEQAPNMLTCIPSGSDTKWLAYPVAWLCGTVLMQGIIRPRMCPFSRESMSRWWKVEDQFVLILRQLAETDGTEGTREVKYVASQTAGILLKILRLPVIVNLTVLDSVWENSGVLSVIWKS